MSAPVHPRAIAARRIRHLVSDALRRAGVAGRAALNAPASASKAINDAADAMERKAGEDGESFGARVWTRIEAYRECAALAAEAEGVADAAAIRAKGSR